MKKQILALAIAATLASVSAVAAPEGGSSSGNVVVGPSTLFGTNGQSGLKLAGSSQYINLAAGPVAQSNNAVSRGADANGNYHLLGSDINWLAGIVLGSTKIAQVWRSEVDYNGSDFTINSVRQMIVPPALVSSIMPNFGGLVIGQVDGASVYFGEWSPKGTGYSTDNSTDLNMSSADRTVWYVGDNAVTATPDLVNAEYNVVGIRQTGEGTNLPGSPELYTGVLTANYSTLLGTGGITGSIDRGLETVDFTGTAINSNGTFDNSAGANNIEGRFYNGAQALAGIYTGGTGAADHVAFGGSYNGNGTITP